VAQSLDSRSKRSREAAYRAAVLLQRHPSLLPHLPMFADKTPIAWGQDSPRLIMRKLARRIGSFRPALWSLERLAVSMERYHLSPGLVCSMQRWIIGGQIFQGYREGLRQHQAISE
jgi:hypothetical protein